MSWVLSDRSRVSGTPIDVSTGQLKSVRRFTRHRLFLRLALLLMFSVCIFGRLWRQRYPHTDDATLTTRALIQSMSSFSYPFILEADAQLSSSGATGTRTATAAGPSANYGVSIALTPGATSVAFQLGNDVQSSGLAALALANKIVICSGVAPTSYANANTNTLGTMAFGIGNCFGAPGDNSGPPANMQLVSVAVTAGSVTANGTPTCWAVVDDANSRLLAWGPLSGGVAVTIGESWTLASFTIQVPVQ